MEQYRCDDCVCKSVCGIYRATGGVHKCIHYHKDDNENTFNKISNIDWEVKE